MTFLPKLNTDNQNLQNTTKILILIIKIYKIQLLFNILLINNRSLYSLIINQNIIEIYNKTILINYLILRFIKNNNSLSSLFNH